MGALICGTSSCSYVAKMFIDPWWDNQGSYKEDWKTSVSSVQILESTAIMVLARTDDRAG